MRDPHINALSAAYLAFDDVDKLAKVVSADELAEHDYNLNITRYVNLGEEAEAIEVAAEVEKLDSLIAERDAAEAKMKQFLQELGYVG